jgi:hypothetical protein
MSGLPGNAGPRIGEDRELLRAGAICAVASALPAFLLWLLPRLYEATNLEGDAA